MAVEVRKNEAMSRYELFVDGDLVGVADYSLSGDRVVMPHTEIVPPRRGEGLADILVGQALEDLRATGRSVVPMCWYVSQFIAEHPEYRDLVAS
jgi:uncharacterized protein